MDAIHYKVRDNGRYVSKAVYTILGLNMEGKKEVLYLYLSEPEGANFWLSVLTDLSNRGVKDCAFACEIAPILHVRIDPSCCGSEQYCQTV